MVRGTARRQGRASGRRRTPGRAGKASTRKYRPTIWITPPLFIFLATGPGSPCSGAPSDPARRRGLQMVADSAHPPSLPGGTDVFKIYSYYQDRKEGGQPLARKVASPIRPLGKDKSPPRNPKGNIATFPELPHHAQGGCPGGGQADLKSNCPLMEVMLVARVDSRDSETVGISSNTKVSGPRQIPPEIFDPSCGPRIRAAGRSAHSYS